MDATAGNNINKLYTGSHALLIANIRSVATVYMVCCSAVCMPTRNFGPGTSFPWNFGTGTSFPWNFGLDQNSMGGPKVHEKIGPRAASGPIFLGSNFPLTGY